MMFQPMKHDGYVVMYQLEREGDSKTDKHYGLGTWHLVSDQHFNKVPGEWLDHNRSNPNWPLASFTASGECWQTTGYRGSFDEDAAARAVRALAKHAPGTRFRAVRRHVTVVSQVACVDYVKPKKEKPRARR